VNCHYAPLPHEAVLHITGPETLKFLQGQVTCDTRKIDAEHALPGAYCTPQGRVVCDFLLFKAGDEHYGLRMRRDVRAAASAVFGKYIIFSKARLDAERDDLIAVAVWGEGARSALADVFGQAPSERFGVSHADDAIVVQTDEHGLQFECFLHSAGVEARLQQMARQMHSATAAQWQARQIADGIARIESPTFGEFVPQILNYDLTGHISFNKGCYTGQEVVARLHYRGKPKRRTYHASLSPVEDCAAGAPVFDAVEGQNVGNVVNYCVTADGAFALVAATADGAEHGLRLGAADGTPITLGVLPYMVDAG
jgi:folate-binding protein YgfZ